MDLIKKFAERAIAAHKKNVSSDITGFSMKKPEMDPVQLNISEKKGRYVYIKKFDDLPIAITKTLASK